MQNIPARAIGALGVALLAYVVVLVVGRPEAAHWSVPSGDLESLSEDRFWIRPGDGLHEQRQMSLDEMRTKYPVPIELPRIMPDGYSLSFVTVIEAGYRGMVERTWLQLRYLRGSDESASEISFLQASGDSYGDFGGAVSVPVSVHGEGALYVTQMPSPAGLIPYERLMWAHCGRLYELNPSWHAGMSWDDLIRIAESIGPDVCP